jgi:hypothetical protein
MSTATPLAARTSRAVEKAGSERAWVSCARKSAVLDDGLGDGEDVLVVEAGGERRTAMAGGAEVDALRGNAGVGVVGIEGCDQAREIHEAVGGCEMAGGVELDVGGHGRKHTGLDGERGMGGCGVRGDLSMMHRDGDGL